MYIDRKAMMPRFQSNRELFMFLRKRYELREIFTLLCWEKDKDTSSISRQHACSQLLCSKTSGTQLFIWTPQGTRPLSSFTVCVCRIQQFNFATWSSHPNCSYSAKEIRPLQGTKEIHSLTQVLHAYIFRCLVQMLVFALESTVSLDTRPASEIEYRIYSPLGA